MVVVLVVAALSTVVPFVAVASFDIGQSLVVAGLLSAALSAVACWFPSHFGLDFELHSIS